MRPYPLDTCGVCTDVASWPAFAAMGFALGWLFAWALVIVVAALVRQ